MGWKDELKRALRCKIVQREIAKATFLFAVLVALTIAIAVYLYRGRRQAGYDEVTMRRLAAHLQASKSQSPPS